MMEDYPVFMDKSGQNFLWFQDGIKCDICPNHLDGGNPGFLCRYFYKGQKGERVFCHSCVQKQKPKDKPFYGMGRMTILPVFVTSNVPTDATIINPNIENNAYKKTSLTTTFDAATSGQLMKDQNHGVTINDHTKLAFKESWAGAVIGQPEIMKAIEEKDKPLKLSSVKGLLEDMRD